MEFQGCESIFEPILGFPPNLKLGSQYLLCGISVLTEPQSAWSPTAKPEIDEAHITWWHPRGKPITKDTDGSKNHRVWAIVVGEPEVGDVGAIKPGTYLLVHGECGRRTPGKIGINYCWTHEKQGYQVYEEIHNLSLGPGSKLTGLDFGDSMEDFLRKLRKAGGTDGEESWKQLIDDILEGKKQGIRAAWRGFVEQPVTGRSVMMTHTILAN